MADMMYTCDIIGNPKPLGADRGNIRSIQFDGVIGTIERTSAVPGRIDVEHFMGDEILVPFREAFAVALAAAEAKREAIRKAHEDAQAESVRIAKAQQDALVDRAAEAAVARIEAKNTGEPAA